MHSINKASTISICEIVDGGTGVRNKVCFKRVADVVDGKIQTPSILGDLSPRKILVSLDKKDLIGKVGVWAWEATYRKGEVEFKVKECPDIKVSLIVLLKNINSIQTVESKLINGQIAQLKNKERNNRFNLLALYERQNDFTGYFVADNQLKDESYSVKENVIELTKHSIPKEHLLDNVCNFGGYQFLRKVDFQPSNNADKNLIRKPYEIIRQMLLNYLNQVSKQPELMSTTDTFDLERLVEELPQQDFIQMLSDKLEVGQSTASEMFKKFVQDAAKYIEAKDIPSDAIYRIVNQNADFQSEAMTVYGKFWRRENMKEVRQATQHLSKLNHEIESAKDKKQIIEMEIETSNHQINELQEEIQRNQDLVEGVAARTNEQLVKIQADATDYLASTPFIQYLSGEKKSVSQQYVSGLKDEESIEISSEVELLKTIEGNLYNLGIEKIEELARFFYASLVGNVPMLLVGPYSEELVDLLSISVYGRHPALLDCSGEFDQATLDELLQSNDKLIIVRNILNSKWVNYIPRLVNLADKQVIFTHPFIEDLRIEPESLFNYMLPIFTELLIDNPEIFDLTFVGGSVASNFKEIDKKGANFSSKFIQQNISRRFISAQMNKILKLYHAYNETRTRFDLDYLCCYAPYAYLTDKQDELKEFYRNNGNVSVGTRERLDGFFK